MGTRNGATEKSTEPRISAGAVVTPPKARDRPTLPRSFLLRRREVPAPEIRIDSSLSAQHSPDPPMNPASVTHLSLPLFVGAGQAVGVWHSEVRPLVANFRKYEHARRDEIVME